MKKKNIIKIFSLIIFILCIISGINFKKVIKNLKPNSNQQEVKKDIEFETYFLDGEKIKILATAQDTENLLSTVEEYENGKLIKKIDCNNKEKVTVDIESDGDANYEFIATNTLGEKISKELVINDELRKNTIKIDISIDENTLGRERIRAVILQAQRRDEHGRRARREQHRDAEQVAADKRPQHRPRQQRAHEQAHRRDGIGAPIRQRRAHGDRAERRADDDH